MKNKDYDKAIVELVNSMNIPDKDRELMIASIYQNLKIRLGIKMASLLSDEQLSKLEQAYSSGDNSSAFLEIEKMIPNFDQLLSNEIAEIKQEQIG